VKFTAFGAQQVRTKVYFVLPDETPRLDIAALLDQARGELGAGEGAREEAWVL
jgi:hypothetical protein